MLKCPSWETLHEAFSDSLFRFGPHDGLKNKQPNLVFKQKDNTLFFLGKRVENLKNTNRNTHIKTLLTPHLKITAINILEHIPHPFSYTYIYKNGVLLHYNSDSSLNNTPAFI